MIPYGPHSRQLAPVVPVPVEEWPAILVGLMETIERAREPLTTCEGCGTLVRPSEHCPGCAMDAHLDELMAAAHRREMWRHWHATCDAKAMAWLAAHGEDGRVRAVDVWAVLLALPFIYVMVLIVNRY